MSTEQLIFHMCREAEWEEAVRLRRYAGSSQDKNDGFIHFSTAAQIVASAGLLLIAVDPALLGPALCWEESRDGMPFPHLYGTLSVADVAWVRPLPLGPDGTHQFPPLR
jgi:uncharacterized protein (DUF952 family)